VALALTTVLASMATGPFGAYHFQTFNPFGLIGNLLALPFVSLVVMPAAVFGVLLYPLGLDALAWNLMGLATQPVLWVSHLVAGWHGSTVVIPAFGSTALLLLALALILATLLTTWLRLLAALPFAIGLSLAATPERPDIFIDRAGAGVAARAADGRLAVMGRPSAFVLEQWLRADGDGRKTDDATLRSGAACDAGGCTITLPDGRTLAWSQMPDTISEDCRRADLVITPRLWRGSCAALMVDRTTLDRHGAMAIHAEPSGLRATTVRGPGSGRPWHPKPRQTTPAMSTPPEDVEPRFSIDAAD
jgi:competence protein ComEC